MNDHTHSAYDRQIKSLTDTLLQMGEQVQEINTLAVAALKSRDSAQIDIARETDRKINESERVIEQMATEMIALRNPMAIDLRYLTSSIKIASCLERAGDLAKHTVKQIPHLQTIEMAEEVAMMERMSARLSAMMHDAMQAFAAHDAARATTVWKQDDEVDDLCDALFLRLRQRMENEPKQIDSLLHLMFASKDFERMADYAAKIAKIVHYVTSGTTPTKETLRAG